MLEHRVKESETTIQAPPASDASGLAVNLIQAHVKDVRLALADPANGWTRHEQRAGIRALELLMRRLGRNPADMAVVPVEVLQTAATSVRVSLFLIREVPLMSSPDTVERLGRAQVILAPYDKTAKQNQ